MGFVCLRDPSPPPKTSQLFIPPVACKSELVIPKRKTYGPTLVTTWDFPFALHLSPPTAAKGPGSIPPPPVTIQDAALIFARYTGAWEASSRCEELCCGKNVTLHPVRLLVLCRHGEGAGEGGRVGAQHGKLFGGIVVLCWSNCDRSISGGADASISLACSTPEGIHRTIWSPWWYLFFQQLAPHPFYIKRIIF